MEVGLGLAEKCCFVIGFRGQCCKAVAGRSGKLFQGSERAAVGLASIFRSDLTWWKDGILIGDVRCPAELRATSRILREVVWGLMVS